eukprot:snap_masked-scaffold_3-processed-gene-7.25-mRNA-1 protein AED:1.00 eAED:1.00 QI:0/-1/0/0/-1/1/1/0/70
MDCCSIQDKGLKYWVKGTFTQINFLVFGRNRRSFSVVSGLEEYALNFLNSFEDKFASANCLCYGQQEHGS